MSSQKIAAILFAITALFCLIAGFTFFSDRAYNIHIAGGYVTLPSLVVLGAFALLMVTYACFYYAYPALFPFKWLTWLHVLLLIPTSIHFMFQPDWFPQGPRRYYENASFIGQYQSTFLMIFMAAQVLFIVHLAIGVVKAASRKSKTA
ncbi:hypothetical protein LX64_04957 [Chitinophaga skermanii]|uniref:Uncharacterized protein n=1 Tax=Chitinophaga skermanii TaxID=331697 RepID=A0A327Q2D0_9BACT|nr:hypothetical protein [Chitinophaga skermanii]RAI97907.1 hypothetical protein LX64_04957 [Chitinophaga skermanii]